MEVVTPKTEGTLSEAAKAIFVERSKGWTDEDYAREVITRFAARAFRTETPSSEYIEKLIGQFRAQRESGLSVRRSLIEPLSIVLASPSFLYMVESTGGAQALTDRELAVRLSYFLWSGPPDEELLHSADAGELSDPDVLRAQTSRLLNDPKAERFLRDFTYQWLGLERLGMFQFQARLYPTFDNAARDAAREEIYETVGSLLDQQLPLRRLLKTEFIFVNDLLADLYGIEGVEGHEFRKVRVATDSPRGGLLGSAAVLAMGSDGQRTSPVERGAWVLRHVLHDPPPPAPPNVPQISRLDGEVFSARRLQVVHQEEPQCAQCHRKIDPIGFGLENFDAAGNWREVETVRTGRKLSRIEEYPIDASGQLPGGNRFSGYFELRDCVAERIDDFARGLVESMIEYALGRPYAFTDQDLADAMLSQAGRQEYEMSQLIHGLVQSRQFQSK